MGITDVNSTNDNDEAIVSDVLDGGGDQIELTVGTTAIEGKVGGSPRVGRKYVMFQSKDVGVYYGMDNTVTTSDGIEIFKDQLLMIPLGENTTIYFIATGANKKVRFIEVS